VRGVDILLSGAPMSANEGEMGLSMPDEAAMEGESPMSGSPLLCPLASPRSLSTQLRREFSASNRKQTKAKGLSLFFSFFTIKTFQRVTAETQKNFPISSCGFCSHEWASRRTSRIGAIKAAAVIK
jgi:hypothetical protein